jgi:hypothetical protein
MAKILFPDPLIPPKPRTRFPVSWSWAVQQIAAEAMQEAGDQVPGEPKARRKFYDRALRAIDKIKPRDGFSKDGPARDRSEAKLRLWLEIYSDVAAAAKMGLLESELPAGHGVYLAEEGDLCAWCGRVMEKDQPMISTGRGPNIWCSLECALKGHHPSSKFSRWKRAFEKKSLLP